MRKANKAPKPLQYSTRQFIVDEKIVAMDLDSVGAHVVLSYAAAVSHDRWRLRSDERVIRAKLRNPSDADWQRIKSQLLNSTWKLSGDGLWWEQDALRTKRYGFSEHLARDAFNAIAEARKELDPKYLSTPTGDKQVRMQWAAEFLAGVCNEARAKGTGSGDKPTAEGNRRMLTYLNQLARGNGLKEIAVDNFGSDQYEKKMRSLSASLDPFCRRVYKAALSNDTAEDPCSLRDRYIEYVFRDWPGVRFPEDIAAFQEAIKRESIRRARQIRRTTPQQST